MEIKVRVRTPKGQAKKTQKKIKKFLLGNRKPTEMYVNKSDDTFYWVYEGSIKSCLKIQKNVARFDGIISGMMNSKLVKRAARKHLSEADQEELKSMLLDHTSVDIIKTATAEEIVESNTTFWQRVKNRFHKV